MEQGHSIGRWDGDTLVVDTALFADHPIGNWRGLPSGPCKHVVERFAPTADRTQLRITFRVEDPDYLVGPWLGEIVWDYVPDGEFLPFVCNPEAALRCALSPTSVRRLPRATTSQVRARARAARAQ